MHQGVQEGREEQALEELLRLRQAPDKPGWVDLSIARYYIRHEQYDEARRILEQRIKRDNSSEARFLLAALLQHEQKYEESLAQVRLIDNKAPEYPEALTLMVSLCRQLNRVDDAEYQKENFARKLVEKFEIVNVDSIFIEICSVL